jgi:NAD(P)-dependent dehydrogenase (short-subunit alcohol dehydrogenase family)
VSRVALVTGASRGIGRAVAVALAQAGHRVAFCYSSDAEGAAATTAAIEGAGAKALAVQADVGDSESVGNAFDAVEAALGSVEILVNNAGINRDGLIIRMTDEHWRSVLNVDLDGAFHTIRRALPKMMKARFGRIVSVSSRGLSLQARARSPGGDPVAAGRTEPGAARDRGLAGGALRLPARRATRGAEEAAARGPACRAGRHRGF